MTPFADVMQGCAGALSLGDLADAALGFAFEGAPAMLSNVSDSDLTEEGRLWFLYPSPHICPRGCHALEHGQPGANSRVAQHV